MSNRCYNKKGFGLVELMIMIIVAGILVSVAMRSMTATVNDIKIVRTETEMAALAEAITGNAELITGNRRSDFGYVGDVGSFPPNLTALQVNPGGYSTWDGPYLTGGIDENSTDYQMDEWGVPYAYTGGMTIISTGSGNTMTRQLAQTSDDYLLNRINGTIVDADGNPPDSLLTDSVDIIVTIPNGVGGAVSKIYHPDLSGNFLLDSMPVGQHSLSIIYRPDNDTLHRILKVMPRDRSSLNYKFTGNYFGSPVTAGLEYVAASAVVTGDSGDCDGLSFDIVNNGSTPININNLILTWATPTAYFKTVRLDFQVIYNSQNSRSASGNMVTFSTRTIEAGQTVTLEIESFCSKSSGSCGSKINMQNSSHTVTFSDGSVISFSVGSCP